MRFGERVRETSTTTSTGSYALAGAVAGHVTFLNGIPGGAAADADVGYVAVDSAGAGFEVGRGVLSSGPATLSRAQIFASSNAGAAVNWSTGTRYLYSAPIATLMQSILRGNRGTARPAWLPEGGSWIDETNAPLLVRYYFDGTNDIALERIDETNNRAYVEQAKGADVASASTTNIGASTGELLHITGTTTITAFSGAVQDGIVRWVVFDGALTLTHGSNLLLPGAANITTAAGDRALIAYDGSSVYYVVAYIRAAGISGADIKTGTIPAARMPSFAMDVQAFTGSGTWTKPTGAIWSRVRLVGPGGGGARRGSSQGKGGGGAGGASEKTFAASALSATETVTIGTGGAGRVSTAGNGAAGSGASLFGAHMTANAGGGGETNGVGVGGTASGGDINITGGDGFYDDSTGGAVGGSPGLGLGLGGNELGTKAGHGYGAGGGAGTDANGGDGAGGYCIVETLCIT